MLKSIFDTVLKALTAKWANSGLAVRAAIVLVTLAVVFSVARLGGLGATSTRIANLIMPYPIPVLDRAAPAGYLMLRAEIAEASEGWAELVPGDACVSSSRLRFTLEVTEPGWLTMFGLSASGRYALHQNGFAPIPIEAGVLLYGGAELDTETGVEVFGFLFSPRPFSASKEEGFVLPHAEVLATLQSGKGGATLSAFSDLPDGMVGQSFYCRHTS